MTGNSGVGIRHVTAVLGPTNTGKTHLAIERMLGHESGMIGLPLRLLAREVYDKIGARVGYDKVALVTGEEKIKPKNARYWVSTVEAMPRDISVAFLAIDEIQLAADPERGHIFTDRLLHARGEAETLMLGAQTMRGVIENLNRGANFVTRPRLSKLTYSGPKKITRLPKRSAIVAFSANEVYSLAELIRRQSGGAAVVLGALSPRTRNAQVGLYQSGEVDYLVATDAIGMGLNLDVDHVAFAATRKFDGHVHRDLTPSEMAQIAGRAGRHMNDGTFGVTGAAEPFEAELVDKLESHEFEPVRVLQWRNADLEFSSVGALKESLRAMPRQAGLVRARSADDVDVLELVSRDSEIGEIAGASSAAVRTLWDACQIPDYRKISLQAHADIVSTLYKFVTGPSARIDEDWFEQQVAFSAKTDGDIDTLSNRIAHIRTWTYVANRADWLKDPEHWQGRTREIEEKLSDALHERLTQRFVDRRTSALMKGMRDKDELSAEIGDDGAVEVEGHFVGKLSGFRFEPDTHGEGVHGKATRSAASHVLAGELGMRVRRVCSAKDDAFKLSRGGEILWRDMAVARIESSDDLLRPTVVVLADEEYVAAADREKIRDRLDTWLKDYIGEKLKPLVELAKSDTVSGLGRGVAFQLVENLGVLRREAVSDDIKALDQPARAQLRKYGVRFGAFNIFVPVLLKPASAELVATLWAVKNASVHGLRVDALPEPPKPGLTSFAADPETPEAFYRVYGYQVCGPRVVRLDILERVADLIRPLLAWRKKDGAEDAPPAGSTGDGGFTATPDMMSVLGCSAEELGHVLKALGFWVERRPVKPEAADATETTAPAEVTEATEPTKPAEATDATEADEATDGAGSDMASNAGTKDAVSADGDDKATREISAAAGDGAPADDAQSVESGDAVEPAVAAGDDSGTGDAAVSGDKDAAKAEADEETFVEVWRPRKRRGREANRIRGRRRDNAAGRSHEQDGSARSGDRAAAGGGRGERDNAPRKDRDGERKGRRRGQSGSGSGGGGGERRWRKDGGRGGNRGAQSFQSSAPSKKRGGKGGQADPDSPFAALSALRDSLGKGDDTSGKPEDKT